MNESTENDGRLSFDEAVSYVKQRQQPAFSAMPVFGERTEDEEQVAEGVRIFIIEPAEKGSWQLRFVAGPFFSNAFAANDYIPHEEVPPSVRELRFMPTRIEEKWFDEQIQILIQHLVKGAGVVAEQMPDYESMPGRKADEATVFPVSFIGRGESAH